MPMTGNVLSVILRATVALSLFGFTQLLQATEQSPFFESRTRITLTDSESDSGRAASVLLRAGLESEWNDNFFTLIEIDHVSTAWKNEHADGRRLNGQPFIPDVESTEVNQAFLGLRFSEFEFLLGRQGIELANQRLVGSNSFWQNEQTFDALRAQYQFLSASKFDYVYIANANRIFGDDASLALDAGELMYGSEDGERPTSFLGDHEHKTHLLQLEFKEWDFSELTAYYFRIKNLDAQSTSNNTLGLRYSFDRRLAAIQWRADIDYAKQNREVLGADINTHYYAADLGLGLNSFELSLRIEELGSKDAQRFITPLASHHDFHGWADKFTAMPGKGIRDQSIKLTWRKSPVKIDTRYHWFKSAVDDIDWGREWDFDLIVKLGSQHRVLLRYADYRSSSISSARFPSEKRIFLNYSFELH